MKLSLFLTACLAAMICAASAQPAPKAQKAKAAPDPLYTIVHNGLTRTYYLHKPANLPAGAPVVYVLHGYDGDATDGGFCQTADRCGEFAVCYPQAAPYKGERGWNVGYAKQRGCTIDDADFLRALINELHVKHGLSDRNVFLTGHSNGGEMCYLCAIRYPDLFAACASNAGQLQEWIFIDDDLQTPVAFAEFHGTLDRVSFWEGDHLDKGHWGAYMPVPAAVKYIACRNRCSHETTDTLAWKVEGHQPVICHHYSGGNGGKDVFLYEVKGGTHGSPWNSQEVNEEAWRFFKRNFRK